MNMMLATRTRCLAELVQFGVRKHVDEIRHALRLVPHRRVAFASVATNVGRGKVEDVKD